MAILGGKDLEWLEKMVNEKFWFFVQSLMPEGWYDDKFHRELCDFLQYGGARKVVVLARTHLKTTICAVYYPLWRASRRTSLRVLEVSNTSPNAEKTGRSVRAIVESNTLYQALFPQCIPDFGKVRWSDRCTCLRRPEDLPEGTFECAGVGANIIRRHFNLIIEDDTVAPKKDDMTGEECMPSRADMEQAVGFHRLTPPLFVGEDDDEQLVVGTRWADYDHIKWIKENEKNYAFFDRPAEDKSGKPSYKRFSRERLDSIRISMGTYLYSSLYLNKPLAKEFMCFNPDWVSYYEEGELPEDGEVIITVDPADPPTGNRRQDSSAIVSCKHCKSGIYVRRYSNKKLTPAQLIDEGLNMADRDSATKIRIEADRYAHLKYGFRDEMKRRGKYYVIEEVKTRGRNKEGRIRSRLQPLYENGVIRHKRGMRDLEGELFAFPNGAHDDLIDALAWQVEGFLHTEYEGKKEKKRELLKAGTRQSFTLEDIRKSVRNRNKVPYPFQRQLEEVVA